MGKTKQKHKLVKCNTCISYDVKPNVGELCIARQKDSQDFSDYVKVQGDKERDCIIYREIKERL